MYRLPPSWVGPKLPWKVAHASLHLLAFTLTVLGLVAVFRYHSSKHIAHLYSLHSWLGITTVFFFACQVGALPSSGFPRWMAATGSAWGFAGISTKHSLAHGVEAAFAGSPSRWTFQRAVEPGGSRPHPAGPPFQSAVSRVCEPGPKEAEASRDGCGRGGCSYAVRKGSGL